MKINYAIFAKLFFASIFLHSISVYFLKTGMLGSFLMIFSALIITFSAKGAIIKCKMIDLIFVLSALFFLLIGVVYVTFSSIEAANKISYYLVYILPLYLFFCMKRLKYEPFFFIKLIGLFVLAQLFIVAGQVSTYLFGVGLPVSENYIYMITGSFTNANDLAAVILSCIFSIFVLERVIPDRKYFKIIWLMSLMLIALTASRTAIILFFILFLFSKSFSIIRLITPILTLILIFTLTLGNMFNSYSFDMDANSVDGRVLDRFISIFDIFDKGISYDGSLSLRTKSYLYFTSVMAELGLGSMDYESYERYFYKADFDYSLISKNPHSLFIEISYWQGYVGVLSIALLTFSTFIYFLPRFSLFVLYFFSYLLITSIPSSTLLLYPVTAMYFFVAFRPIFKFQHGNDIK